MTSEISAWREINILLVCLCGHMSGNSPTSASGACRAAGRASSPSVRRLACAGAWLAYFSTLGGVHVAEAQLTTAAGSGAGGVTGSVTGGGRCSFADAEACLQDRAALVIGTSVSRHWYFALQEVLTRGNGSAGQGESFVAAFAHRNGSQHEASYRAREMELCGGGAAAWRKIPFIDKGCSWYHAPTKTSLRFQWASPFQRPDLVEEAVWDLLDEVAKRNGGQDSLGWVPCWGVRPLGRAPSTTTHANTVKNDTRQHPNSAKTPRSHRCRRSSSTRRDRRCS